MTAPDASRGTTRRALLRNSALGVGALVGGTALVTTGAEEAGASTSRTEIVLTLDGIAASANNVHLAGGIEVRSVSWALTENIDTLSNNVLGDVQPTLLVLTMDASRASSALCERVLNGHRSASGKIRMYAPNIEGVVSVRSTITLTDVHVVGFHQKMTATTGAAHSGVPAVPGGLIDTVKLTYASVEFRNEDSGKQATYTVPPPP